MSRCPARSNPGTSTISPEGFAEVVGRHEVDLPVPGRYGVAVGLVNVVGARAVEQDRLADRRHVGTARHRRGRMGRYGDLHRDGGGVESLRRAVVHDFQSDDVVAQRSVHGLGRRAGGVGKVEIDPVGGVEVPIIVHDRLGRIHVVGAGAVERDPLTDGPGIGLRRRHRHRRLFEQRAGQNDHRPGGGEAGRDVLAGSPGAVVVLTVHQLARHAPIFIAVPVDAVVKIDDLLRKRQAHRLGERVVAVVVAAVIVVREAVPPARQPVFGRSPPRVGRFEAVEGQLDHSRGSGGPPVAPAGVAEACPVVAVIEPHVVAVLHPLGDDASEVPFGGDQSDRTPLGG